ncbi:MAG: hypothetical protein ACLS5R_05825 [Blautia sp.]
MTTWITRRRGSGASGIKELSCTVFVSSRIKKLEGFRNFQPKKSLWGLIFRDNYERTLNMEERENLNQLLEKALQHPLTLRLWESIGARLWTLEELERTLRLPGRAAGDTQGFGICTGGSINCPGQLPPEKTGADSQPAYRKITRTFTKMFSRAFEKELLAEERKTHGPWVAWGYRGRPPHASGDHRASG